jgi:hypothetical protein
MDTVQQSQDAEKREWKRPVLQRLRSSEAENAEGTAGDGGDYYMVS